MFRLPSIDSTIRKVLASADVAQKLINDLYERDPTNETFEQVGMLDGREIIQDYIDHNEWGLGLEHLLYMINEANISYPADNLQDLHAIAKPRGFGNLLRPPQTSED